MCSGASVFMRQWERDCMNVCFGKPRLLSWPECRPRSAPQCPDSVTESVSFFSFLKDVYAEFMRTIFPLLFALIHKPQHFQKALNSLARLIFQKPHLNNKPPAPPTHKNHSREKEQKMERDNPAFTSAVMKIGFVLLKSVRKRNIERDAKKSVLFNSANI